jgi:hypothetical protein
MYSRFTVKKEGSAWRRMSSVSVFERGPRMDTDWTLERWCVDGIAVNSLMSNT